MVRTLLVITIFALFVVGCGGSETSARLPATSETVETAAIQAPVTFHGRFDSFTQEEIQPMTTAITTFPAVVINPKLNTAQVWLGNDRHVRSIFDTQYSQPANFFILLEGKGYNVTVSFTDLYGVGKGSVLGPGAVRVSRSERSITPLIPGYNLIVLE